MKPLLSLALLAATLPALAQPSDAAGAQPSATPAAAAPAPRLQGLVFLAAPGQFLPQGRPPASTSSVMVDVSRTPLLQQEGFAEYLAGAGLIGAPLDDRTLVRLRQSVFDWLRRAGIGATVLVPAQDATGGVVQVIVSQPRMGTLKVEGANRHPESEYRAVVRARPGEALDTLQLEEDLAWIQRANPFRSAVAVAAPGARPGETDITLQVTEDRPWKFGLWADNTGTEATQRERLGGGITTGNFLGLGHLASYNLAVSPDFQSYVGHTGVWSVPLPWRDKLNVVGNYVRVRSDMPEPMASEGSSGGVNVRYDRYLRSLRGWSHGASLALDYKESDNNLLFSSEPVFGNRTAILQLQGAYDGYGADDWGRTQLRLGLTLSPGDLVSGNDDAAFQGSRADAKARYVYGTLALQRSTDLPAAWRWVADVRGQWSSANLLGSEQLPAMGMFGVRGFPEGGLYADRGLVWRNEVGPGQFALGEHANVQVFGILDAANVGSASPLPGEQSRYRFASLGLGARFTGTRWQAQVEAGKPVSTNWDGDKGGWRAHARVSWDY